MSLIAFGVHCCERNAECDVMCENLDVPLA